MRKEQVAVTVLAVWLIAIAVVMHLLQSIDLEIFYVLALIGFLVIVELISPKYIQPGYRHYLKYIMAAAIVIFGLIAVQKVVTILA